MAIPNQPEVIPFPIAERGDIRNIPEVTPSGTNQFSFASGFPSTTSSPLTAGGIPPQREDFNAVFKTLSEHIFFMQSGGFYTWSENLNYLKKHIVLDEEGVLYQAIKPSGVDFGGAQPTSNTEYWENYVEKFLENSSSSHAGYELGEFYYFRHPKVREGFEPAQGGIIQRANVLYPEAWEYFQTAEGKQLCTTEDEWQAMTKATWATLADDTEVGFNGIGGAPFYVQDLDTGTLRLPDIRGMYAEASGFDGLGVGDVHGDMVRNIMGKFVADDSQIGETILDPTYSELIPTGVFLGERVRLNYDVSSKRSYNTGGWMLFNASRVVPTGNANKPRAWGVNACVYLGKPNITS